MGAFRRRADGRPRDAVLDLLDSGDQQLDADARRATRSSTGASSRRTGCKSSSIRRSPTASPIRSTPSTSPPDLSSSASPPPICGAAVRRRGAPHAVDDAVAADRAGAAADSSSATRTASTRSNISPPRSRRSRRSGTRVAACALNLFAIPDEKAETNRDELAIPDLGSLILTHDPNGTVRGLKDWPADQRPSPVAIPFFGFRIMVGIGLVMLAVVVASLVAALAGRAFRRRLVPVVLRRRLAARLRRGDRAAGRRPKSAASRGRSTGSCAPPIPCRRR